MNQIELFKAQEDGKGKAVKYTDESLKNEGLEKPNAECILEIPASLSFSPRRIVIYPHDSPKAFPLNGFRVKSLGPNALTIEDLKNNRGSFMPTFLRTALQAALYSAQMNTKQWILIALCGATTLFSAGTLWLTYKIVHYLKLI